MPKKYKCSSCLQDKNEEMFYSRKENKNGLQGICKKCFGIKAKRNREAKPDKYKLISLRTNLKMLYRLSLEEYNNLVRKQDYKCAICGIEEVKLGKRLSIDHNHLNGKVRGLLCPSCNFAMGHLKVDSVGKSLALKLIQYIKESGNE